jgi:hypothetical protein
MELSRKITMWCITLLMFLVLFAPAISADDDDKRHQRRERRHGESHYNGEKKLKLVSNATYADQCVTCHFTYPQGRCQTVSPAIELRQTGFMTMMMYPFLIKSRGVFPDANQIGFEGKG